MNTKQARELGQQLASLIEAGQPEKAQEYLSPILTGPMAFRLLDQMGAPIGRIEPQTANPFLDWIGTTYTEGGWVVIGSAVREWISLNMAEAFDRTRQFILQADVWYATDSFGERVVGPALLYDFQPALELLKPWRQDNNRWVRRAAGVACHFWAKRRRGALDSTLQAKAWLEFIEPLFEEHNWDALKGVGWGLKTLGRYYPDLVREWLIVQVVEQNRPFRSLVLRKALTYLPEQDRQKVVLGLVSR